MVTTREHQYAPVTDLVPILEQLKQWILKVVHSDDLSAIILINAAIEDVVKRTLTSALGTPHRSGGHFARFTLAHQLGLLDDDTLSVVIILNRLRNAAAHDSVQFELANYEKEIEEVFARFQWSPSVCETKDRLSKRLGKSCLRSELAACAQELMILLEFSAVKWRYNGPARDLLPAALPLRDHDQQPGATSSTVA